MLIILHKKRYHLLYVTYRVHGLYYPLNYIDIANMSNRQISRLEKFEQLMKENNPIGYDNILGIKQLYDENGELLKSFIITIKRDIDLVGIHIPYGYSVLAMHLSADDFTNIDLQIRGDQ